MKKLSFLLLCSFLVVLNSCSDYPDLEDGLYAEFKTNRGTFVAELYQEDTPITVASFVSLAEGNNEMVDEEFQGKKFYNGLIFHRVIKDFMIQGGDPSGTGSGGPGYKFPNETKPELKHDSKGILSMANSGPDTNGSQFFVTLKETPWLDGMHTVFGKVVLGQEVVDSIGSVETAPGDRPVEEVVMEEVNIIRKGKAAKNFKANQVFKDEIEALEAQAAADEQKMAEQMQENAARFEGLRPEAEELESGLGIVFNEESNGETPSTEDTVLLYYAGYLTDGSLFDTNIEEVAKEHGIFNQARMDQGGYAPMPMPYSPAAQMIPGFKEGVQKMKVGDKATLFIPSHLGYGERGFPPVIPESADLIFEVELVDIQ